MNRLGFFIRLVLTLTTAPLYAIEATLTAPCALELEAENLPPLQPADTLNIDFRSPLTSSFEYWLKSTHGGRPSEKTIRAAMAFAISRNYGDQQFQSNRDTIVKFSPNTGELLVVSHRKILYYVTLRTDQHHWFEHLRRARLRSSESLAFARGFSNGNLQQHFRSHGHEFNAPDEADYNRQALRFAQANEKETLLVDVQVNGHRRTLMVDLKTWNLIAVSRTDNAVITYFTRQNNPYFYLISKTLP